MAVVEDLCEVADSLVLTPVAGAVLLCGSEVVANRGAEARTSLVAAILREACEVERCPVAERCLRVAPDRICDRECCPFGVRSRCGDRACALASTAWAFIALATPMIVLRTAPPKISVPASP